MSNCLLYKIYNQLLTVKIIETYNVQLRDTPKLAQDLSIHCCVRYHGIRDYYRYI